MILDRDIGDEDDGFTKRLDAGKATREECVEFLQDSIAAELRRFKGSRFSHSMPDVAAFIDLAQVRG
jgi:hypothetical protein